MAILYIIHPYPFFFPILNSFLKKIKIASLTYYQNLKLFDRFHWNCQWLVDLMLSVITVCLKTPSICHMNDQEQEKCRSVVYTITTLLLLVQCILHYQGLTLPIYSIISSSSKGIVIQAAYVTSWCYSSLVYVFHWYCRVIWVWLWHGVLTSWSRLNNLLKKTQNTRWIKTNWTTRQLWRGESSLVKERFMWKA